MRPALLWEEHLPWPAVDNSAATDYQQNLRWPDPVILGGYHPTLKLSGIPPPPPHLYFDRKSHMDNI